MTIGKSKYIKQSLVLALLVVSIQLFSQAPGYMGKRFSAGYGIYASPGWVGSEGLTPVNLSHEAFVEFATGKKFSVGLSVKYYNAVTPNYQKLHMTNGLYSDYNLSVEHPGGITRLRGLNYMLYGKFFKKKYLAPWGKYFILGATLNTITASYDPDQLYLPYIIQSSAQRDYKYFTDLGPTEQRVMKFDVVFGNGRSRIIANKIILDYGYNIYIWSLSNNVFNAIDGGWGYYGPDEYISRIAARRAKGVNGFNIFLKVGYLF